MTASTLRRIIVLSGIALVAGNANRALAGSILPTDPSPMFSVTDLGTSYTLQQNSSGAVQTVTSGDGSQVYAFVKSPVIQINQTVNKNDTYSWLSSTTSFQVGNIQYGYNTYVTVSRGIYEVPFATVGNSIPSDSGWSNGTIADGNAKGQFVGTASLPGFPQSAAFSFPNGALSAFGPSDSGVINYYYLNEYIAQNLGINLTSAVKIDDNGDIIAEGIQNAKYQDFLLTLNASPTTAPEPSTLLTLGIGAAAFCWVRRRRRLSQAA